MTGLLQVTSVKVIPHVIKEEIDRTHCVTTAFLQVERLAVIHDTHCSMLFAPMDIVDFVQLKVDVRCIRDILELERWIDLHQEVGDVCVMSRVKSVSRLLTMELHWNPKQLSHWLAQLLRYPEAPCPLVKWSQEHGLEHPVHNGEIIARPVDVLSNTFIPFRENHVTIPRINNKCHGLEICDRDVHRLSKIIIECWSNLLLQILEITVSRVIEISLVISLGNKWASSWGKIVVPRRSLFFILKVSVYWEVDEAIGNCFLFQKRVDLLSFPDVELWHSKAFFDI